MVISDLKQNIKLPATSYLLPQRDIFFTFQYQFLPYSYGTILAKPSASVFNNDVNGLCRATGVRLFQVL